MRRLSALFPSLEALATDRSGASALITGLTLTAVMGFAAFGVDGAMAYNTRRAAQNAADSAAFSAAVSAAAGAGDAAQEARTVASSYGFTNGADGAAVTVNQPPLSGSQKGNAQAVEVIVSHPMVRFLSGVLGAKASIISARAVAVVGGVGDGCVIALDPTQSQTVLLNGQPQIKLQGCSLYVNSSSSSGLYLNGSANLTAKTVNLVGSNYFYNGQATVTATVMTRQSAISDPYANVPVPAYSGCNKSSQTIVNSGDTITFHPPTSAPYVFCNGLTVNSSARVTFDPGIYIIDRGSLIFNGGAIIRGTGVTFVLTSSTGSGYASLTVNGGADVNLTAPTSGPTAGLVFYQDRRAPSGVDDILNGGVTQVYRGALYFPNQRVLVNGGAAVTSDTCTELIAARVEFNGNSNYAMNCQGMPIRSVGGSTTALVE